jgi:hypothetical protein
MNMRFIIYILGVLILGSCVQTPSFKGSEYALVSSNYPIISVNGVDIEGRYKLDIDAGENTLVIVYHTYIKDYHCTFKWQAIAGIAYEVTDQENSYPLTLYRWQRKNRLWAMRLVPVDPLVCSVVDRDDNAG